MSDPFNYLLPLHFYTSVMVRARYFETRPHEYCQAGVRFYNRKINSGERPITLLGSIFDRWVRMKRIAWPDEVRSFVSLMASHYYIHSNSWGNINRFVHAGAAWVNYESDVRYSVRELFGWHTDGRCVLYGEPVSPKLNKRDAVFFKYAARTALRLSKEIDK